MRLSLGLEQKLVQKQVLAPRMIQSMEILQLPIQALQERIEQEMNENPVLETPETDPDVPDEPAERENPDAPEDAEKELVVDEAKSNEEDFERLLKMDQEWPGHFEDSPRRSAGGLQEDSDRKQDAMANVVARRQSLQDFLQFQLHELDLSPETFQMAVRIITSLDTNGYLPVSLEDLLPPDADERQLELARKGLAVVQRLEPPGIGARSLRECLLLQLKPEMSCYTEMKALISAHLEDLKDNRMPAIQRKTGYSVENIQTAWSELRKLNPKPGADFNAGMVPSVTPDVFVEQDDDGTYKIKLDEGGSPRLRISRYYRQRLMSGDATAEEKEFIKRKLTAAQWLIESIEQRRGTLTKVAQAIVDHQTRFLDEGPEHIEPLKMQQIADKVGVHVTTVSRAVDDKWIQTPRGILSLKRFFVGGTTSDDGEEVAWDAIRIKLQEVIDHEHKTKPFSDDELVKELKKHGLNVARRTITKYRQKMGIPTSRQRRDWSQASSRRPTEGSTSDNGQP